MRAGTGTGMDGTKQWVVLGVLGALALLVGGWVLLVSPKNAEAALLREQAATQAAANEQSETHVQVLRSKADEVPEREVFLEEMAARIPDEAQMPDLLRALSGAATSAGVELVSVVPGNATAVAGPASAAPTPAPAAPPAPAATGPAPAGGLRAIPLTIEVVGGFYEVEQFLAGLEELPRALRVTDLALAVGDGPSAPGVPAAGDGLKLKTVVTASVFVGAVPAATGTAPATATAPPTGTAPAVGPAPAVAGEPPETTS